MTSATPNFHEASPKGTGRFRKRMAVSNPYTNPQPSYGFCTSTPHPGFHPFLPPLSAIYSPFTPYYQWFERSSTRFSTDSSDPSTSLEEHRPLKPAVDRCSPPPRLLPYNTPLSEDSGFFTSSTTEGTPAARNSVRGYKKTFCAICKVNINREGKRSQGPRRHLLQHHVQRPLFQCPHCSHSSFYDKFHVTSHMRRIHQDNSDKIINRSSEFVEEVNLWYKRCFGDAKETTEKTAIAEELSCQLYSSPPPVLTPEPACKENIEPDVITATVSLVGTASKGRKRGFMVADLLQLSPEQNLATKKCQIELHM